MLYPKFIIFSMIFSVKIIDPDSFEQLRRERLLGVGQEVGVARSRHEERAQGRILNLVRQVHCKKWVTSFTVKIVSL